MLTDEELNTMDKYDIENALTRRAASEICELREKLRLCEVCDSDYDKLHIDLEDDNAKLRKALEWVADLSKHAQLNGWSWDKMVIRAEAKAIEALK